MSFTTGKFSKNQISKEEWAAREDLACCYQAFFHYGWTDLIYTHLSVRVPGAADQYLINPYGLLFDEIEAGNLLKVDFDGNVIVGDYPYNEAGHAIHTAVLRARPDINAVLHSHTRAGTAVSCMECGLLPLSQQANEINAIVGSHKYGVVTDSETECRALGKSIADKWALLLENHGLLTVGRTVGEAFHFQYMLETACKIQVDVMASGAMQIVPDEEAIKQLDNYGMPPEEGPADYVNMSWDAVLRLIKRKYPS